MEAPQREQTEAATPEPTGSKRKRRSSSDSDRLPRIPRLHPAVGQWLTDTYERSELDDGVPCAVLYDEYKRFCHSTGLRPVAHTILGKFLQQVFPGLGRVKRSCGGKRIPEYQLVLRRGCSSSSDSDTDSSRDMEDEEDDEFVEEEYDDEEEEEETKKYLQNKLQQKRKRRRAAIVHSIVETTHHTTTEETTETEEHYLKLDVLRRTQSSKDPHQRGRRFLEYKDFIGLGIADSMYCTLYNLGIEFSVCKIVECKKYLDAYAQIFWPMLPIPWIIVNGDVIENYSLMKDTEKDVMKLNIWVAIFVGAGLFGDHKVSEKLYYQAMDMIPFIHDSLDLNMVTSLIYMSSYAFMLFDLERGATIALNYILLAEATCIARNATNTEMYGKVLNLKFWLTRGESNLIMPEDKYPVTEEISSTSSLHLRTEVQRLVNIRHAFNSVMAHKMYLEKAISLVRVCKAQLSQNLPLPNGAFPGAVLLSYSNELKRLRRIGSEVLQQINGQVHPVAYELQVLNHNSTVSMTYSEMGNQKKAAKFATLCIDQLDRQGSMPYYFYLKECPRVLAQAGAWDQLARFIRISQEYDRFQYVAFLRDSAKQLLAGALTSFPSHAIGNYSPKGQPIPTYCDKEETVQQNQIIEAFA